MPTLPQFVSRQAVQSPLPYAGGVRNPGAIGNAIQGGAKALEAYGKNLSVTEADSTLASLRLAFTQDVTAAKENLPEGDPAGFSERLNSRFQERLDALGEGSTMDAATERAMRASAERMRAQFMESAVVTESRLRGEYRSQRVRSALDNLATSVYQNPVQAADAQEQAATLLDGSSLPGPVLTQLRETAAAAIADARVRSLIDVSRDPAAARAALDEEAPRLSVDDVGRLTRAINTAEKSLSVEARANNATARALMADVRDIMVDGDPLDPDFMARVDAAVRMAPDPRVQAQWADMKSLRSEIEGARRMSPAELESYIETDLAPAVADGATPLEKAKLDGARTVARAQAAQLKAIRAEANSTFDDMLDGVERRGAAGRVPAEDMQALVAFATENAAALSSENKGRLTDVLAQASENRAEGMPPVQLESVVRALQDRAGQSEAAQAVLDIYEDVLARQRGALDRDPLTYADTAGVVRLQDVTDLSFGSLTERHRTAEQVSRHYGRDYRFFTPAEVETVAARMRDASPSDVVGFAKAVASAVPARASEIMAEFDDVAPGLALVGGLVAADDRLILTAETIVRGQRLLAEKAVTFQMDRIADLDEATASLSRAWTGADPRDMRELREAARALMATDESLDADDALSRAAGAIGDSGGIESTRFSDATFLAPGVSDDDLETAVERMTDADLAELSVNGLPPVYDSTVRFNAEHLDDAEFQSIGPGLYEVFIAGAPVLTADGSAYTIRLDAETVPALLRRTAP